jgi:hypothetical protein
MKTNAVNGVRRESMEQESLAETFRKMLEEGEKQSDAEFLKEVRKSQRVSEARIQDAVELKAAIEESGYWGSFATRIYERFHCQKNPVAAFRQAMIQADLDRPHPPANKPLLVGGPSLVFLREHLQGLGGLQGDLRSIEGIPEEVLRGIISRLDTLREDLAGQLGPDPRG